ncbi:MAG: anthranilate synthase component I family protein [Crocinitomicaceae bacterium]
MENIFYFNSNNGTAIISAGVKAELVFNNPVDWSLVRSFLSKHANAFVNILLSYDLKNSIEKLHSSHKNWCDFPTLVLIVPTSVYKVNQDKWTLFYGVESDELKTWWEAASSFQPIKSPFEVSLSKNEYLGKVREIQNYIQLGDVYEVNFCQQYTLENVNSTNSFSLYKELNKNTNAPFSVYFDWQNWTMLGASPERFLKKTGNKLLSQPIKGTRPRALGEEDERLKQELKNDPKERAENIMIVDLVRNDLAKVAIPGTVHVDELCEIYSFETVHQMISTISCELRENVVFDEIIQATFPMGSMTGAPKVRAMEIIEEKENFQRGLYAGSVGYILPDGDFDLNVVIRSILFNKEKNVASCAVGGAITILSEAEKEYEECHVKINRILSSVHE